MKSLSLVALLTLSSALCNRAFATSYVQTNLVSDMPGTAVTTDTNLKDAWGVSFSPTSPIWVSDRETDVSTLYNGVGTKIPLTVTVPTTAPIAGPTGQVFAGGTNFRLNGNPVPFIFDTLGGTIDAWNGGNAATIMVTSRGASYTGLALANNMLYAANFTTGGGINVFDSTFAPTTVAGGFKDPNVPAGYAPFNIQLINGNLYVEYAKLNPGTPVPLPGGGGYVDVFDTNGNLLQRLVSNGPLDAPWGVALAPAGFGPFGNDLLIGNFGNGEINAFSASNGSLLGTLSGGSGPFVNSGLWALAFDPGVPGSVDPDALYLTAGPNQGADGLFARIDPVPEPAAWILSGIGFLGFGALRLASKATGARR